MPTAKTVGEANIFHHADIFTQHTISKFLVCIVTTGVTINVFNN